MGESHYEAYKMHIRKVYDEVRFAWVNSPLFHEFVENVHNLLYYKMDWREPKIFIGQEVCDFYQENLDEEGYISYLSILFLTSQVLKTGHKVSPTLFFYQLLPK